MKLKMNKLETKLQATEVEIYIINKVMEYRVAANYSKRKLALELRLSEAYIRQIENPKCKEKYNVNLLNEAAKILGCRMADFMPDPFVQSDSIEEYMNLHPEIKTKYERLEKERDEKSREKLEKKETVKRQRNNIKRSTKKK
ncbi:MULTISPECIES: XRE family transcriptional regulator [unclassified Butyricimonas]|uniref:XRE family transcriptional regulator n=1 Tax=unclassified Butyricimonas TaxID=2637652 RepID=UPI001E4AEEF0|nr:MULTISPECIES: XRE family transcriptional regulator [unclassified Butyricimonas]